MKEINGQKYYDLGYSHEQLMFLLNKINDGYTLSEDQYKQLIDEIGLENISTFDGDYNSLKNLPNIDKKIVDKISEMNLASNPDIVRELEEVITYVKEQIALKANVNHDHDETYYTKEEVDVFIDNVSGNIDLSQYVKHDYLTKELLAYVTVEFINAELKKLASKTHTHKLVEIESIQEEFNKKANLDDVYSKNEVYNTEEVNKLLENITIDDAGFLKKDEAENTYLKIDTADDTYSKIEDLETLTELLLLLETSLSDHMEESNNVTSSLDNKINSNKQDLDAQIDNLSTELNTKLEEKANKEHDHSDIYFTKAEVEEKIVDISTGGSINLEGFVKQEDLLSIQQNIEKLQSGLNNKVDENHIHEIEDIEGLQNLLDSKSESDHSHDFGIADIEGLQEALDEVSNNVPSDLNISDINGLQEVLDNKASKDHSHDFDFKVEIEDIEGLQEALDNKSEDGHFHNFGIADIDGLQEALNNKANSDDVANIPDDIMNTINNKSDKDHEHEVADINGLQDILDNKADTSIVCTKSYVDDMIANISSGGTIDLGGYVKQEELAAGLATKTDHGHSHLIENIEDLKDILDGKAEAANTATKQELVDGLALKSAEGHLHDDKYSELGHNHNDIYYTKEEIETTINDSYESKASELIALANIYTDTELAKLTKDAPEDFNTFAEVAEAITNQNAIIEKTKEDFNAALATKENIDHTHTQYATIEDEENREIFSTTELTISALGGIPAGANLNGLTVKEILNKLLYPYLAPTIAVQGTPNGGIFEKGNNQTITSVKVIVTKKSEKITKIEVLQGSNVLASQEDSAISNGGTFTYAVNIPVNSTNVQLTGKVTDASGTTRTSTTASFNFVYPYYVGVCGENDTIDENLIKGLSKRIETKGTKIIPYTTNQQRMIIAYPKSYGSLKRVLDANSFDVTDTFTRMEIKITGLDGTSQSYYVYVNNASTVSDFTMTFNY